MQRPDLWRQWKEGLWQLPLSKLENYVLGTLELLRDGPLPSKKLYRGLPFEPVSNDRSEIMYAAFRVMEEAELLKTWSEGMMKVRALTPKGLEAAEAWVTLKDLVKGV